MASTANQVIEYFRERARLNGWPVDHATSQRLLNNANREILFRCRLLREDVIQVSLTDGTRQYDLSENALTVLSVDYKRSATDRKVLRATSVDEMDMYRPGWRSESTDAEGEPHSFFIVGVDSSDTSKQQIAFDPIPSTTTSSGYPIVDVHCIEDATLSTTETVHPMLLSDEIYVDVMMRELCKDRDPAGYPYYEQLAERQIAKNILFLHGKDREPARLVPGYSRNRVV